MIQFRQKEKQTYIRSVVDVCVFKNVSPVLSCKQTSDQLGHKLLQFLDLMAFLLLYFLLNLLKLL